MTLAANLAAIARRLVGTAANNLVALDANGKLPAIDGSQLIDLPSSLKRGVAVSLTGTAVDITGIPSSVKRLTLVFKGIQKSGSAAIMLQLGTVAAIETTGYRSVTINAGASSSVGSTTATNGLLIYNGDNTLIASGILTMMNIEGNEWVLTADVGLVSTNYCTVSGGDKTLSDILTRFRLTTTNGTDNFTAGRANLFWE